MFTIRHRTAGLTVTTAAAVAAAAAAVANANAAATASAPAARCSITTSCYKCFCSLNLLLPLGHLVQYLPDTFTNIC